MKKLFILLFIANFAAICAGQNNNIKKNLIYAELGGLGGHYSINYSRKLDLNTKFSALIGIGFSPSLFISAGDNKLFSPRIPMHLKAMYSFGKHSFELGAAATPYKYFYKDELNTFYRERTPNSFNYAFFGLIGYNYLINKKLLVGLSFTPMFYDSDFEFFPWGGLRFGYYF